MSADDTKKKTQPVGWRVTPQFRKWLRMERGRRDILTSELLEELAKRYIVEETKAGRQTADWPVDL